MRPRLSLLLLLLCLANCGGPVGRSDWKRFVTTCVGGINQNAEEASREECADARNVWAPNGKVVSRPGYVGVTPTQLAYLSGQVGLDVLVEDPLGTFTDTDTLDDLPVGSRWYFGLTSPLSEELEDIMGLSVLLSAVNTNDVLAQIEYYNGTEWVLLNAVERGNPTDTGAGFADAIIAAKHLGGNSTATVFFAFIAPQDFSTVAVSGVTRYWIRFTIKAKNGGTALDAATAVDTGSFLSGVLKNTGRHIQGPYVVAAFKNNRKRYIFVRGYTTTLDLYVQNSGSLRGPEASSEVIADTTDLNVRANEPGTMALVSVAGAPDEAFVAFDNLVTVHKAVPAASDKIVAVVETADFAVGVGAPYSKEFVAQRGDFPAAKYILFNQGRIWYSTDSSIGWGAPVPYHKVFPLLSEEPIDGGAVTGLAALGEQTVVFTENAIFVMVLRGVNAFGLAEFIPVRRVSGVGCTSNAGIKQIRGELIFPSHDGLYAFNGSSVRKLTANGETERLGDFWASINKARRKYAVAADWKSKSHYLLAVTVDGAAENNRVLVYDYDGDTFWIWDGFEAALWMEDRDSTGDRLYFVNAIGHIFEFGKGHTDNGGTIESWVTTQRLGYRQRRKVTVREVAVWANNMAREVDVDVLPDDSDSFKEGTISLRDPIEKDDTALTVDVDKWHLEKMRLKTLGYRVMANHAQVKITHDQKNKPFSLSAIDIGYEVEGAR